jgi:hypothetical protein
MPSADPGATRPAGAHVTARPTAAPIRRFRGLVVGLLAALLTSAAVVPATPAQAADPGVQETVDGAVAHAAASDVQQAVAVIDRVDGTVLASRNGDTVYNSESILKLFTAAYYLVQAGGQPDAGTAESLRTMIVVSDNGIQSALWRRDIVPTIVERYGLTGTANANNASARNWGSGRITANDEVRFLWGMSQDPLVGPTLMGWMAASEPAGSDGFDQAFGLNAMTGDHGSKQGWSDAGWSPYNIHSVGWTGRFFVAILQTSYSAGSETMKDTSTFTAQVLTDRVNAMYPPAPMLDCAPTGWLGTTLVRVVVPAFESALDAVLAEPVDWCPAA